MTTPSHRIQDHSTTPGSTGHLPLSVWPADSGDQATSAAGGDGCRAPVTERFAHRLITTCTRPGDLVIDIHPADHTFTCTAVRLGRRGACIVTTGQAAGVVWTRAVAGRRDGDQMWIEVRVARPQDTFTSLAHHRGQAALVIIRQPDTPASRPSRDEQTREQDTLSQAASLLAEGKHLAVVTGLRTGQDGVHDPAPELIRQAQRAGLAYLQHVVALHGPTRQREAAPGSAPAALDEAATTTAALAGCDALPAVRVHTDVLLFTRPAQQPDHLGAPRERQARV